MNLEHFLASTMAFSSLLGPSPSPYPCLPFSPSFLPSGCARLGSRNNPPERNPLPPVSRSTPPKWNPLLPVLVSPNALALCSVSRNAPPERNSPSSLFSSSFNFSLAPAALFQAIAKSQHGARKAMAESISIEKVGVSQEERRNWPKVAISCLLPLVVSALVVCKQAQAAESIKASSLGLRFASFLRGSGWPDEAIVFVMAMLPVLELRGAIPVGYWMHLPPIKTSLLAILGNMVPVPFIMLYLEKIASFVASVSPMASHFLAGFYESTRKKAEPIQEFEWLGLMLFVAVPFPGTGAWTGAIAASILGMSFWSAVSANFFGVVLAGLLVNLVVNLGIWYAVFVGIALFVVSTFMWKVLRYIVPKEA